MAIQEAVAPASSAVASSAATWEKLAPATGASSGVAHSSATYVRLASATGASSAAASSSVTAQRLAEALGASAAVVSGMAAVSLITTVIADSLAHAFSSASYEGEDLDAWITNAGTGAAGQLHGFNFNSFALIGNRMFAFGDGGVYELAGSTDDGQPIPFYLAGGTMRQDMGKMAPDKAYLVGAVPYGVSLFALTDADVRYDYPVDNTEGRLDSSAVQFGRGLRVRHLRYGLYGAVEEPLELSSLAITFAGVRRNT